MSSTRSLPSAFEPLLPNWRGSQVEDLALELLAASSALSSALAPITAGAMSDLVRLMNSYYSNLIEGQHTHPLEIERALAAESGSAGTKDLAMLAAAHVETESALRLELSTTTFNPVSVDFIRSIHRSFYERLPSSLSTARGVGGEVHTVHPGEFREVDVKVGMHVAPSPDSIPALMTRFTTFYARVNSGVEVLIAAAASHHRLAWIHPFLDGNGRVTRLFTQFFFERHGLGGSGLWSLSRGLARRRDAYYEALAGADCTRRDDYDGRGNLSEKGLSDFVRFIFEVSLDQVRFISALFDLDGIMERIRRFVELQRARGALVHDSTALLQEAFLRGEVERGRAATLLGLTDRRARDVTRELLDRSLLVSSSHRAPLRIHFPVHATPYYFPRLFPETVEATM